MTKRTFAFLILIFCLPGSAPVAQAVSFGPIQNIDLMMGRLEGACPDYQKQSSWRKLKEMLDQPVIEGLSPDFRMMQAFDAHDWVPLGKTPACKIALTEFMLDSLTQYVNTMPDTSWLFSKAYRGLAYAYLARAALKEDVDVDAYFSKAGGFAEIYLKTDKPDDENRAKSQTHYFIAHTYINAAELTSNRKLARRYLESALSLALAGAKQAKDNSLVATPAHYALRDMIELEDKNSVAWRSAIERGIAVMLPLQNASNSLSLEIAFLQLKLGRLSDGKKWLEIVETHPSSGYNFCSRISYDVDDLTPLIESDASWTKLYVQRVCNPAARKKRDAQLRF
ncbi:MAG: hypothetical protein QM776_18705 [Rhodocyclaceae bacterium]